MDKKYSDILYETAEKEIEKIVVSNLEEYSTNKISAALYKAYKVTICGEFLSMFEYEDYPDESVSQKILKLGKNEPLEFLYNLWLDSSIESSLRDNLKEIISGV